MPPGGKSVRLRENQLTHDPTILNVLENHALFDLFNALFAESSLTFPFKWMRAVGNEQYTAAHYDFVYMGRGSLNLHTLSGFPSAISPSNKARLPFAAARITSIASPASATPTDAWMSISTAPRATSSVIPLNIVDRFGGAWLGANYERWRCHHLRHAHDARLNHQPHQPFPPQLRCALPTSERTHGRALGEARPRSLCLRPARYEIRPRTMGNLIDSRPPNHAICRGD